MEDDFKDESERLEFLDQKGKEAMAKYLDRRALLFLEEAIANFNERHGRKKTIHYLEYMIEYLNEFITEENDDV